MVVLMNVVVVMMMGVTVRSESGCAYVSGDYT
jgi:hypothetical protein